MSDPPTGQTQTAEMEIEPGTAFDCLERLLETQMDLVQHGRLTALENLGEQSQRYVETLVRTWAADPLAASLQRPHLEQLYGRLCLILTGQRDETAEALSMIRQGKRMLRTYGEHVS